MKAWFQINTAGRAYAWLLGFAVARTFLDYFWVPIYVRLEYKFLSFFNTTIYLFTLYLVIPAIAGVVLERLFTKPVDYRAVLRESVLVWVVYPAVTIISLITKSPPTRTIELFRYIPTFMVDYNFLPSGMIAVIPILIVFYVWLMMRHSGADWRKALFSVIIALLVIYLAYYQYMAMLSIYIYALYGPFAGFGFYTLTFLIPLFPLAKRFNTAFGEYHIRLLMVVLGSSLVCVILIVVGIFQGSVLGVKTPSQPSVQSTTANWNLRFFQLYDETDKMVAYGYFSDLNAAERSVRRFRFFHPGSFFFENIDYITTSSDRLSYQNLLDIRITKNKLVFEWNRANARGDSILETFQGTDAITECTASLEGESYRCFLLDENLSADISRVESWDGETFLAITEEDVSMIVIAYDDYIDGVVAFENDQREVTSVSRTGLVINISFEDGSANVSCTPLAEYKAYEILKTLDPQPIDNPVRCEAVIQADNAEPVFVTLDGLLEWIGQTQGE